MDASGSGTATAGHIATMGIANSTYCTDSGQIYASAIPVGTRIVGYFVTGANAGSQAYIELTPGLTGTSLVNTPVTATSFSTSSNANISGALYAAGNVYSGSASSAPGALHLSDANNAHDMGWSAPSSGFTGLLDLPNAAPAYLGAFSGTWSLSGSATSVTAPTPGVSTCTVTFSGGTGNNGVAAVATVTFLNSYAAYTGPINNMIATIAVTTPGSGYLTLPTSGALGNGAGSGACTGNVGVAYGGSISGANLATGQFLTATGFDSNGNPTTGWTSFNAANAVVNDGPNTGAPAMTLDMSAAIGANAFKVPVKAGATATVAGAIAYDSTNGNLHIASNGADAIAGAVVDMPLPANGNCAKFSFASSAVQIADAGAACSGTQYDLGYYAAPSQALSDAGSDFQINSVAHTLKGNTNAILDMSAASATAGFKVPAAGTSMADPTTDAVVSFDTGSHVLKFGANGAITEAVLGTSITPAASGSTVTIHSTDRIIVPVSGTGSTYNLPTSTTLNPGYQVCVEDMNNNISMGNIITIAPASGDVINGASSVTLQHGYGGACLTTDANGHWFTPTIAASIPSMTGSGGSTLIGSSAGTANASFTVTPTLGRASTAGTLSIASGDSSAHTVTFGAGNVGSSAANQTFRVYGITTVTWSGAIGANSCSTNTVSLVAAPVGAAVFVSPNQSPGSQFTWSGYVSSTGTVNVSVCNLSGTPATPASSTVFTVAVVNNS